MLWLEYTVPQLYVRTYVPTLHTDQETAQNFFSFLVTYLGAADEVVNFH